MKKIIFALFITTILAACSTPKIYNDALMKIELGMTQEQVTSLMGKDYTVVNQQYINNQDEVTLRYVDYFKNQWFFVFINNSLVKWYKETEGK